MSNKLFFFLVLSFLPVFAEAHTGANHTVSFATGFFHPLAGLDHIVVMLAVGLWAMLRGGRSVYLLPLTFVSVMAVSAILAMTGIDMPYTESGILFSNAAMIALVLISYRFSTATSMAIIGLFAVFHGFSHGMEMPVASESLSYITGFVTATGLLHLMGILLACVLVWVSTTSNYRFAFLTQDKSNS